MNETRSPRVALVTGSTRGLGKAIALRLAREGMRVAMNFHGNANAAADAFAELEAIGGQHCLVQADVTDPTEIARAMKEIESSIGPVDVLVPNATCAQPMLPIEDYDWEFGQRMVDFFIKSPFLLTQACLPYMKTQRWGRIVHITSEVFEGGWKNFSPYVAAKGGQVGLAKSTAAELASHGITVNMVAPGWIPGDRHDGTTEEDRVGYTKLVPAGRMGTPADVASAVAYFAHDDAGFVTGTSVSVNGGRTIG